MTPSAEGNAAAEAESQVTDTAAAPSGVPAAAPGTVSSATVNSVFQPTISTTTDSLANQEAVAIGSGKLKADAESKEHDRHQKFRDNINLATLRVFWSVVWCLIASIFIFTYHLITPDSWHFLSPDQLGTLKTLLGGAILSSALSGYVTKRMKE
jgi:hypothetical protein